MSRGFAGAYAAMLRRPRATASELATDPRVLSLGFRALLIAVVGYVIVYVGLAHGSAYPSTFSPWLSIPAAHYYDTNVFLVAPSMIAGWLLASAVVHLLGAAWGGRGTFEQTAGVLGFAISIAHWTLLPHDLVVGTLGALGVIDAVAHEHAMNAPTLARTILWTFMALYVVAFPVYFTAAIGGAKQLSRARSVALGLGGFAIYQLVFLLFNR